MMKNIKKKSVKNLTNYQKNYLLKKIGKSINETDTLELREMYVTGVKDNNHIWITFFIKPYCNLNSDPSYRLEIYNCGKILFSEIIDHSDNPEEEDNSFNSVNFNPLIIYKALNVLGFNYSI